MMKHVTGAAGVGWLLLTFGCLVVSATGCVEPTSTSTVQRTKRAGLTVATMVKAGQRAEARAKKSKSSKQRSKLRKAAVKHYKRALKKAPQNTTALRGAARVEGARKRYASANKFLVKCLEVSPKHFDCRRALAKNHSRLAARHERKKDARAAKRSHKAAVSGYQQLLKQKASDVGALFGAARSLRKLGQGDAARKHLEVCVKAKKPLRSCLSLLGELYAEAGETTKSVRLFKRYVAALKKLKGAAARKVKRRLEKAEARLAGLKNELKLIREKPLDRGKPSGERARKIAQKAFKILKRHCYRCHGKDGTSEDGETYVLDRDQLVKSGTVKPGDATSNLIEVVSGPEPSMPDEGPKLKDEEVKVLVRWISEGAPDWRFDELEAQEFLTEESLGELILSDLKRIAKADRQYARYFSLAHLYNARRSEDLLKRDSIALSKLLNSLSWAQKLRKPKRVKGSRNTLYRIDLRHYDWDAERWQDLEAVYPYAYALLPESQLTKIQGLTRGAESRLGTAVPYLRADWFLSEASKPPLYHTLLQLPDTVAALERQLGVNSERNITQRKAIRAGTVSSQVSDHNRVIERHDSALGRGAYYWKSFDFASSQGKQNIMAHPLDFEANGGEMIFSLPNGLQAYLIVDERGQRIDEAPTNIVSDKSQYSEGAKIVNGLSCMSCHHKGMRSITDDVRGHLELKKSSGLDDRQRLALGIYVAKDVMDRHIKRDKGRFVKAVKELGVRLGRRDIEPIMAAWRAWNKSSLSLAVAAAELGLEPEDLRQRIKDQALEGLELEGLASRRGRVRRDVWMGSYADVVAMLQLGERIEGVGEEINLNQ